MKYLFRFILFAIIFITWLVYAIVMLVWHVNHKKIMPLDNYILEGMNRLESWDWGGNGDYSDY
jgi:hypothetical protein